MRLLTIARKPSGEERSHSATIPAQRDRELNHRQRPMLEVIATSLVIEMDDQRDDGDKSGEAHDGDDAQLNHLDTCRATKNQFHRLSAHSVDSEADTPVAIYAERTIKPEYLVQKR